jgi:5'-3' exonuclease
MLTRFGESAVVVFDGYKGSLSTKDHEHRRRASKFAQVSADCDIEPSTLVAYDQETFLANCRNKCRFIDILIQFLENVNITTRLSRGDADTDVVEVTLQIATRNVSPVVVYAEDTDVLVMLLHHCCSIMSDIYFICDGKKNKEGKCINVKKFAKKLGTYVCQLLPVLHALGGCDTTSAIFGHGKGTVLKRLNSESSLHCHLQVLQALESGVDEVKQAGVAVMVALFNGSPGNTLGRLRYEGFKKLVTEQASHFNAERLPPSQSAAELHALRVHLQAVVWRTLKEDVLNPIE